MNDVSDDASNDDAFGRLRATDPARTVPEPAAGVLRAKVDALLGSGAPGTAGRAPDAPVPDATDRGGALTGADRTGPAGNGAGVPGSDANGTDELARRRRHRPWLAAAAVAGFVVVGAGGYVAGSGGVELTVGAADAGAAPESAAVGEAAEPPIVLDRSDAASEGSAQDGPAAVPEDLFRPDAPAVRPEIGRDTPVGTLIHPAPPRTVFHPGAGLSGDEGESGAYALDAAASYSRDTAERAASAFGLRAGVREEGGAWVAGPGDGGPALRVSADGITSLWFTGDTSTWRCAVPGSGAAEPAEPGGGGNAGPDGGGQTGSSGGTDVTAPRVPDDRTGSAPVCPDEGKAGAPSPGEAIDELRRAMETLGVDTEAFEFETRASGTGTAVVALHVIDGRRTGLQWSAEVTGSGSDVAFATVSGFLAPVVDLGSYPVVSEREAAERLGDARFGASHGDVRTFVPTFPMSGQGMSGQGMSGQDGVAAEGSSPEGSTSDGSTSDDDGRTAEGVVPPAAPAPGSAIGWPVRDVTITAAELGVARHVQADGAVVLVPAYELTGDDGGTWSVLAVAGDHLDLAAR